MDVRNCRQCGRPYLFVGTDKCPACLDAEEEAFNRVRDYLREHPGAGIDATVAGTGVERGLILQFLRQGRLQLEGEAENGLTCQLCGKPIPTGRFCGPCAGELAGALRAAAAGPPQGTPEAGGAEKGNRRIYVSDQVYGKERRPSD